MKPRRADGRIVGATLPSASSTHLPALMAAVAATDGLVLEVGMGYWSTPILHEICRDRWLVSLDENAAWAERFRYLRDDHHLVAHNALDAQTLAAFRPDVALVDCTSSKRAAAVRALAEGARLIVLHDVECQNGDLYDLQRLYPEFRHVAVDRRYWPATAVLSNRDPFPFEDWSLP